MLLISENDIQEALTMEEVIASVRAAFVDYSNRDIDVPRRITMNVRGPENSAIFLAANYLSRPYYGLKQASSFPMNQAKGLNTVFSDIHLYSAETSRPLAVISANRLTAMKTGAAAAVATDALAGKEAGILAIIGTGVQAQTQIAAIQQVRPLREVRLYDRDKRRAEAFAEYVDTIKNRDYKIVIAGGSNDCIAPADIISTATTSSRPVISGDFLQKGAHVNAVGSFTPEMQEIDTKTIVKADKIATDNIDETWLVAGDLLVPLEEKAISASKVYGELGDIVSGKLAAREDDTEITLYESVGFAALDIAVAVTVYEKMASLDGGVKING